MRLALFPLGTVLFPGAVLPLQVFEPRYRQLVQDLRARPQPWTFGVIAIREGRETGSDGVRALYDVGCVAEVRCIEELPDGRFGLETAGTRRFRLVDVDRSLPYLQADVELLDEPVGDGAGAPAAAARVRTVVTDYVRALAARSSAAVDELSLPDDPTTLSYAVAAATLLALPERQALLAAPDTVRRLTAEADLLAREVAVMRSLHAMPAPDLTRAPHHLN